MKIALAHVDDLGDAIGQEPGEAAAFRSIDLDGDDAGLPSTPADRQAELGSHVDHRKIASADAGESAHAGSEESQHAWRGSFDLLKLLRGHDAADPVEIHGEIEAADPEGQILAGAL